MSGLYLTQKKAFFRSFLYTLHIDDTATVTGEKIGTVPDLLLKFVKGKIRTDRTGVGMKAHCISECICI